MIKAVVSGTIVVDPVAGAVRVAERDAAVVACGTGCLSILRFAVSASAATESRAARTRGRGEYCDRARNESGLAASRGAQWGASKEKERNQKCNEEIETKRRFETFLSRRTGEGQSLEGGREREREKRAQATARMHVDNIRCAPAFP